MRNNELFIELNKIQGTKLLGKSPIDEKFLFKMLENDFYNEIISFLNQYYEGDSGTVNRFNIDIEMYDFKNELNEIVGYIYIIYDVNFYYGCRDIDSTDEDLEMKFEFYFDNIDFILKLVGDKIFERDPDEY